MRTCPFCAATNADDAPYCATCGRSGVPAVANPPSPPPPQSPAPQSPPPQSPPPGPPAPQSPAPLSPPPQSPAPQSATFPAPAFPPPAFPPPALPPQPLPAAPFAPPWPPASFAPNGLPLAAGPTSGTGGPGFPDGGLPAEPSRRGPLVLVITSAGAALLLMLAAYLGSIAPPAPASHLKQPRPGIVGDAPGDAGTGAHGR